MIIDQILHAGRYQHVDVNIAKALAFIYEHKDEQKSVDGIYEIIPNQIVAYIVTKETVLAEDAKMEIHKEHMDIHYLLEGSEICGFTKHFGKDSEYDAQNDIAFSNCIDETSIVVNQGEFYAVWPEEPHRPLVCTEGKPAKIRKIICKVSLSELR